MAQLKDDCFAFGGDLTPLHDALTAMHERISVVTDAQTVPIDQALGRILSQDIIARRNVPPHDNSAVDGYAVYFNDLDAGNETRLPYTGRIAAGHPLERPAVHGEALRIFTGAPMPTGPDGTQTSGPDTVFMEEDVTIDGDMVVFPPGLKQGSNRRDAGEDICEGTVILK
ncbi:MAG: molybdopterin molybdenumtransferase MoeA, partial [Rhodospirillales bacterium]|nr:molybdopterin molybdenumtransferase MoeA [Rhodospirillales bacterium]